MSEPAQLWGTVSVRDHLRPQAFVAELVLFDTIVIPRPPTGVEWPGEWDAASQEKIVRMLPRNRVLDIPWDGKLRGEWEKRWAAEAAEWDAGNVRDARRHTHHLEELRYHATRQVLGDHLSARRDRALLRRIPQVEVTVIPAYSGPQAFREDSDTQEDLLRAFGWEFLVPDPEPSGRPRRTHRDLIKAALELAEKPEVRAHREAFRAWTSLEALRSTSAAEAHQQMEEIVEAYAQAVARSKIPVVVKWAIGIARVTGKVAEKTVHPGFAVVDQLLQLGEKALEGRLGRAGQIPDELKPAGLIHAMREEFTRPPEDLDAGSRPRIHLEDHWPRKGAALYH